MNNLILQGEQHGQLSSPPRPPRPQLEKEDVGATESTEIPFEEDDNNNTNDVVDFVFWDEDANGTTNSSNNNNGRILLTVEGRLVRLEGPSDDAQHHLPQTVLWSINVNQVCSSASNDWFSVARVEDDGSSTNIDTSNSSGCGPLCVCLSHTGAIVLVQMTTGEMQLVGEFDNGLLGAAWSPDGDVVVLATTTEYDEEEQEEAAAVSSSSSSPPKKKTVLMSMTTTTDFNVLSEVTLLDSAITGKVSMTWKPDGALLAVSFVDPTEQESSSIQHQRKVRLYQRETLHLEAVGRTEDGSGRLLPHLAGNSTTILAPMAWAGPGCSQLLATVQQAPARRRGGGAKPPSIIFLEPNGLQHGQFALRDSDGKQGNNMEVLGLAWNCTSDLLAVAIRESFPSQQQEHTDDAATTTSSSFVDKVQLWHRSNYHWYLKRELRYEASQNTSLTSLPICHVAFHDERPYHLRVLLSGGQWREYTWNWDAHVAGCRGNHTDDTTYVVDGCSLCLTPLQRAVVPPPMAAATLIMPTPICEVAFANYAETENDNGDYVAVVTSSDGTWSVLTGESEEPAALIASYRPPKIVATGRLPLEAPTAVRHVRVVSPCCAKQMRLVAVVSAAVSHETSETTSSEHLKEILLQWNDDGHATLQVVGTLALESSVLAVTNWSDDSTGILLELDDGQLLEYEPPADGDDAAPGGTIVPCEAEPLLEPCPWIAALKKPAHLALSGESSHRPRLVFGKSERLRLFCHDLLLADAVTSFVLSTAHQFLSYVTASARVASPGASHCQLRFLALRELYEFDPLMGSDADNPLSLRLGYEPRNVERGSRIVAVLGSKPSVVLQMPRGNLEGVYPRALVLSHVMHKISRHEYRQAFEMMRRQKVDLNLLVDMDPWFFVNSNGGASCLVEQIQNIDHLNLFVSCLQNGDTKQGRYPVPRWLHADLKEASLNPMESDTPFDYDTKVNQVCQSLREILVNAERSGHTPGGNPVKSGHYLLPILSTFAKEEPPKLEQALSLIKEEAFAKAGSLPRKKPPMFSDHAQHSIQYLAFLADYELLFETALGMYDYDIARAVARYSQMDPKKYLPLLKRYRELPVYYGRYEVDLRLKRYEMALENLFQSGSKENIDVTIGVPPDTAYQGMVPGNGFEHCMSLIERFGLHRIGLELFHDKQEEKRTIMLDLGDMLLRTNEPATALNVFLVAFPLDIERIKKAARVARDWRTFFSFAASDANKDTTTSSTEIAKSKMYILAHDVANELIISAEGTINKRERLAEAAQVLLDYGNDPVEAVDVLIKAEQWSEAKRISKLHNRPDMVRKCVEEAIIFAQMTMEDLEERKTTFVASTSRYIEVLQLRKEAIASGESADVMEPHHQDDTGSLFSAASDASNLSSMSRSSTGSTGSVGSISTVISVKSTSTFTISGAEEATRHKSKFNQVGRQQRKKKKKKKRTGRVKIAPGSEQELRGIVETLQSACINSTFCQIVRDTVSFLIHIGNMLVARELYDSYSNTINTIRESQAKRIKEAKEARIRRAMERRFEGAGHDEIIVHPVEAEVDALECALLPAQLQSFFELLPAT